MPQSTFSVWILILTLSALLTACGGSSGSDPQPEPHQPPPGQSTPGDDNEPDDPGGNTEPEPEPITTPNSFSFAPQEGVTPGELLESNTITLTGITAPASISIADGEYKLGDGSFTAEAGHIEPGQSLTLRTTAPNRPDTTKETVVTVGGVAGRFIVHTMEDTEPPTASIIFPNVISASEQRTLTIRGTAEDELSEVTRVTVFVNGLESASKLKSEDNFATWQVTLPLEADTEHTITVSVEDEFGNVDTEAATAVVHQQAWDKEFPNNDNVFLSAEGITYDEEGHRVFISDGDVSARLIVEVDLATGKRTEFFNGTADFSGPAALAIDKSRKRLLVTNTVASNIFSLSLEGEVDEKVLTSSPHEDEGQPSLYSPRGIVLDPEDPDRAFVTASTSNNLAELDLRTGLRTLLSDDETPDGENSFKQPRGLLVDHNNNRILVGSWPESAAIFSVDKETGKRTIFSGADTGGGDIELFCPGSLGSDRIAERILVGDCNRGIISVDIDTGERTLITDIIDYQGFHHGMYLYVEDGWEVLYYVDSRHRALLMLDLVTEEHVVLSKGARPD